MIRLSWGGGNYRVLKESAFLLKCRPNQQHEISRPYLPDIILLRRASCEKSSISQNPENIRGAELKGMAIFRFVRELLESDQPRERRIHRCFSFHFLSTG